MTASDPDSERPNPEPPALSRDDERRLHAADLAAYGSMFTAGATTVGSGRAFVGAPGGAMAMWNPRDESSAYNTLIGFEWAPDPDAAWAEGLAAARAGGAAVFGVGLTEERYGWGTPERLLAAGLKLEYEELVWTRAIGAGASCASGWVDSDSVPESHTGECRGLEIVTTGFDQALLATTLNRGWEVPPEHGRGPLYAAALGLPGWTHYLALVDGEAAGAGALFLSDTVACFMVVATDPAYRGRGVQRALIARRMADAVSAGCSLAVAETVDDNASPRNFRRAGFRLAHRRMMYRTEFIPQP